ncbi:MAG: TonB-dependent receptor [Bacteroidales bacterium]|jgi:outer membrane receptor for ferrienterochelin and colicin|nr:TonB-dependent receptor [Bacteroidales bacterium]
MQKSIRYYSLLLIIKKTEKTVKSNIIKIITVLLCSFNIAAAQSLTGSVSEYADDGTLTPVVGATVQWQGTSVGAVTGRDGTFTVARTAVTNKLLVRYPTYDTDTIEVSGSQTELKVVLASAHSLQTVNVSTISGAYISVKPIFTTVISTEGLRRAACCNLSESFENTVAVDVEYADAVSGAKQISMLGLAGIYSQILLENVPYVRQLSHQFGLGFIPGTWMEMISISKGTSSVTNGYEAITGQIDVEYKKPETNRERLFVNLYGNTMGKMELNLNSRFDVGKKQNASSMLLFHAESQIAKIDMNHDNFLDLPLNRQINLMNRWDYRSKNNIVEGRTMVSYLFEDRIGGEKSFNPKRDAGSGSIYGLGIRTHKLDAITKNGFLLKGEYESVGTILSFTYHNTNARFGQRKYDGEQLSGYANIFYSNKFGKTERHKLTTGASMQFDHVNQLINSNNNGDILHFLQPTIVNEAVPGVFAEYSYSIEDKFIIMPGFRLDYNLLYSQLYWTPRLHVKWQITEKTSLRASAGKGYRTANVYVENMSLMVSNRTFETLEPLKPEEAWNAGISFVQEFTVNGNKSSFSADYFYTRFMNQTLIDLDQYTNKVLIYNLNGMINSGKSYSHSFQADLTLTPIERFEIVLAYRFNDVWQTMNNLLQRKALTSPHKALLNLNYATKFNRWKFSATLQYNSAMRLPSTESNPEQYRLGRYSPDYLILNAQVTYRYKGWEFYIGGENLTNYRQKHPVLSADNPFGPYFDASMIYAPVIGAMGYAGFRFTLK